MDNDRYIPLDQICDSYEIEVAFVQGLESFGLVQIVHESTGDCIDRESLADIERMIRLHYDLEINMAGLEAIHHLLERVREMQREIALLKSQ
jgi:hypothetical protein